MADLKGTKTEQNLKAAFAGESEARNKYTYYASKAKKEGFVQISNIFAETAANEKEHAELWFKLLHGDTIPDTATNLLDAGVAGNILENDIRIEYAGEVYPLADETGRGGQPESDVPATRMLLPAWNGLSLGMTDDCGPCLKFGEFGPTKMYKNECFTLDLGTGRTWNISFNFWVDGINTDNPVVHSSLYVDGEKMDFPLAEIRLD